MDPSRFLLLHCWWVAEIQIQGVRNPFLLKCLSNHFSILGHRIGSLLSRSSLLANERQKNQVMIHLCDGLQQTSAFALLAGNTVGIVWQVENIVVLYPTCPAWFSAHVPSAHYLPSSWALEGDTSWEPDESLSLWSKFCAEPLFGDVFVPFL